jgi:hypothetical protein
MSFEKIKLDLSTHIFIEIFFFLGIQRVFCQGFNVTRTSLSAQFVINLYAEKKELLHFKQRKTLIIAVNNFIVLVQYRIVFHLFLFVCFVFAYIQRMCALFKNCTVLIGKSACRKILKIVVTFDVTFLRFRR